MFSNQVQDPVYVIIIAHLCNLRDTLEELSKASRRVGSSVIGSKDREENCNGNQESWSRSEAVSLERIFKKEKDLEVKDDSWQIDEIDTPDCPENVKASEEAEEDDNDDLDNALAEAELTLEG